ncbi:hypothetical protein [Taibaiella chishuiensis]|uniref:Uncharacterized protein n=1 Tax=Taibaiella chishuiensis TaxID=1434707 RepID=A0A2P8D3X6_9BACT|nr:hypothetical protein [Taibaiella chishuiensis]PSK91924.1 hypothetical protein B0I18_10418 [Taibaiella chishuiensis]
MNKKFAATLVAATLLSGVETAPVFAQKHKKDQKETHPALQPWQVDTLMHPIPFNRQLFTDNVAKQVKAADARDGEVDGKIELEDAATSATLTKALLVDIPLIDIHIENLDAEHQTKIKYHRALENLARRLNGKSYTADNAIYIKKMVRNFEDMVIALEQKRPMEFAKENANIYSLDNSELLDAYPEVKAYVFEEVGKANPEMMIKRLKDFAKESYADPIVAAAARVVPGTILTYATSTSSLSAVVKRNKDPLVQTIVQIATESRTPLRALPFLKDIYNKKKTIAEVDAITNDPVAYYKNLVRLKIENNEGVSDRAIEQELNYRGLQFVRVVNELHDSPAPVRFKSLLNFNAEELYFMMIGSQDEIYTSSFTWMCNRMIEQMKPQTGDELLTKVNKSHFRTFLRMCAGYNTLSSFLATMNDSRKTDLMKEFVANLEKGGPDDLEDAVDVADAFGSITDPNLISFLQQEVRNNYERASNSEKGIIVYGLLTTIFKGADNSAALSGDLRDLIPPITYVPRSSLQNDKGEVIEQIFFYGDKDGMGAYNNYLNTYKNNKWKIATNEYWSTITSVGPNPVIIYANRPLPEEKGEDEIAQKKLAAYLAENNIVPTVIIHRGHSYFLPTTLEYLSPAIKIVMLGSCGGYHNLANVLNTAQDAHIISSKQVGALNVNMPIIKAIDDQLLSGKDVDWIQMWEGLSKYFSSRGAQEKDLFSDYVPPNKNLGAIFIKAYRKQLQKMEG